MEYDANVLEWMKMKDKLRATGTKLKNILQKPKYPTKPGSTLPSAMKCQAQVEGMGSGSKEDSDGESEI